MGKVSYTNRAREDLTTIWLHIAPNNPSAADRVVDRIEDRCNRLRDYPQLGRARVEIAGDARILIIERWVALYHLVENGIQIVRIVDGTRDLTNLEWTPE